MKPKEIALKFFEAADSNDFITVEKLFGTRHRFYSPMTEQPLDAAGHLGLMKSFHKGFSDMSHEIQDTIESGNKVVVRGTWHAKHTGTFNGITGTGKSIILPFILIFEIENEEIRNKWIQMDSMSMLVQMGAMPSPATA